MNTPGFTAENSIYDTRKRYSVATAFDSRNGSANVQPARTRTFSGHCRPFLYAALAAQGRGDDLWAEFWWGALEGCWELRPLRLLSLGYVGFLTAGC